MTFTLAAAFPLIEYQLLAIAIISAFNLYIGYEFNKKDTFGKVINAFSIFILFHACYVWTIEFFFNEMRWLDQMMPFIFVYGPFLHFSIKALQGKSLSINKIWVHLIPFAIFFLMFMVFSVKGWYADKSIYRPAMRVSSLASVVSVIAYTSAGIFGGGRLTVLREKHRRTMIITGGVLLIFVAIFFLDVTLSRSALDKSPGAASVIRATVYSCMLLSVLVVSSYLKTSLLENVINKSNEVKPVYSKSKLTDSLLDEYKERLEKLMNEEKPYLDPELSLEKLALKLRIPAHYVTQTLSLKLGVNFTNYINKFRVAYAANIILSGSLKRLLMEELAYESGFNSKISFNRNFKSLTGKRPSEYIGEPPVESIGRY